ncbi:MAG: hypothetical protein K2F77_06650 [Muribaculaceae bacterium]|nr:hypothetical protein [Muribaculaceae bacterium]
MSKLKLKKELEGMDRAQLVQVILDAYAARKETREYFEFFLDPDVEKLREKTLAMIDKELRRGKHGRSTSRITVVRRAFKDFTAFDPGEEYVRDIMLDTLRRILMLEKFVYFKDTFEKGTRKLIDDIVAYADSHALMDSTLRRLHEFSRDTDLGTSSFRNRLLSRFMYLKFDS